nr:MAG TPA: hypothetical protein [Caudoviricetes sp.]
MVKRSKIFLCCHVDLNLLAYIMIKTFFEKIMQPLPVRFRHFPFSRIKRLFILSERRSANE